MVMKAKSLAILTVLWTITNIHLMNVLCEGGCKSLTVKQSPAEITLPSGSTGQLLCRWDYDCKALRARVEWSKNGSVLLQQKWPQNGGGHLQQTSTTSGPTSETFTYNLTGSNDSGLYVCKVTVEIPLIITCEGNGSKVTFNGTDNIAKGERSVFPQYLVISAVLGGTLILLFIALSAGLRKSIQGRCQDKHVYTNTSEGYLDKFKSTCACPLDMPDSQSEDNNQNTVEMIDEKNKTDVTEDDLSTDDDGKRAFHVNRNDIVEARRKLRGKRGNFFKGDTRTNTETDGFFKRKKSLHLYINSQELKKQIQKAPEAISAQTKGTKKQGESQRRLQRAREQQLRSDDIYANT